MDRRMFDMSNFFQESAYRRRDDENSIPECCYDTNFCVKTPREMNNGVLTMAFVDMQPLESVYETDEGFDKGGLFPNINKPFFGGMKK